MASVTDPLLADQPRRVTPITRLNRTFAAAFDGVRRGGVAASLKVRTCCQLVFAIMDEATCAYAEIFAEGAAHVARRYTYPLSYGTQRVIEKIVGGFFFVILAIFVIAGFAIAYSSTEEMTVLGFIGRGVLAFIGGLIAGGLFGQVLRFPFAIAWIAVPVSVALVGFGSVAFVFAPVAVVVLVVWAIVVPLVALLMPLVFWPLRIADWLKLRQRGALFRCPHDDCAGHGFPLHSCTCGASFPDLRPSFRGVLHHGCLHGTQIHQLPTLDGLGRNHLPRSCGRCRRPLVFPSVGLLPERSIAVVGGPGSGKRPLLLNSVAAMCEALQGVAGNEAVIDAEEQRRRVEARHHALPGETFPGPVALGVRLRLRSPRRLHCLLYLFDVPEADCVGIERFGRKLALQHAEGIVLVVAVDSLPAFRQSSAGSAPLAQIVGTLLAGVGQLLGRDESSQIPVPLAVVLAGGDSLPGGPRPGVGDVEKVSRECRATLERFGAGNEVRALEHRFGRVRYFCCPAPGRSTRGDGLLPPLSWLLGIEALKGLAVSPAPAHP